MGQKITHEPVAGLSTLFCLHFFISICSAGCCCWPSPAAAAGTCWDSATVIWAHCWCWEDCEYRSAQRLRRRLALWALCCLLGLSSADGPSVVIARRKRGDEAAMVARVVLATTTLLELSVRRKREGKCLS